MRRFSWREAGRGGRERGEGRGEGRGRGGRGRDGVMNEFKRSRVDGREIDREKSKQVTHRGT